jgi:hypothetical protein
MAALLFNLLLDPGVSRRSALRYVSTPNEH